MRNIGIDIGKGKCIVCVVDGRGNVLERLPDVTFYWAGDNPYAGDMMGELESTPNSGINIVALAALG